MENITSSQPTHINKTEKGESLFPQISILIINFLPKLQNKKLLNNLNSFLALFSSLNLKMNV